MGAGWARLVVGTIPKSMGEGSQTYIALVASAATAEPLLVIVELLPGIEAMTSSPVKGFWQSRGAWGCWMWAQQ